ncbi:MAG: SPFH domain-containing protein [Treponema sp.]|jgi:hypothetical protein|nr:SPFH domain-containing protein [Treponema sp.]
MFGIRYAKFEPGRYVFRYQKGRLIAEGEALSFYYYAPSTSLVVVPVGSADAPFMFSETSADFQELTIQGQLVYRIADPAKTAKMLNYSVHSGTLTYLSDDPEKLPERMVNMALIATRDVVKKRPLREAIVASDEVGAQVYGTLVKNAMLAALGVEALGVSIMAIKPTPETAKALEAETREDILKGADEAIFRRRNYAVEQERVIRESELNTEIAVENKNREIQQTRLESERLSAQKQRGMEEERLKFEVLKEEKNGELVDLRTRNEKIEADTKAYALREIMQVYQDVNPDIIKALANAGLDSKRLMAQAFQGIADKAEKIGNLNITPDLLEAIMKGGTASR